MYFAYFNDPSYFKKTFNNEERLKFKGLSHSDIRETKDLKSKISTEL